MMPPPPPHQVVKRGVHPVLAGAACVVLGMGIVAYVLADIWGRA